MACFLGLLGKDSYAKFIPQDVFVLTRPRLALFLNRLFSGDGGIWMQKSKGKHGCPVIGYGSMSQVLVRQVQHLLLRFGIISCIRDRTSRDRATS